MHIGGPYLLIDMNMHRRRLRGNLRLSAAGSMDEKCIKGKNMKPCEGKHETLPHEGSSPRCLCYGGATHVRVWYKMHKHIGGNNKNNICLFPFSKCG